MLKAIVLLVVLGMSVGCNYIQTQPKGNDRPPAPRYHAFPEGAVHDVVAIAWSSAIV